ncbi:hypothetical protein FOC4_g10000181 [Fusarium odoratissimum]|uniref:Uncharacterized protein n=2 Tax=Fusarium oxysporum species complex TaxID=171631 RepID=N1RSU0_FUSC4
MLYISEYKPPHKLSSEYLRAGLRITDMHGEVVNRRTIPTSIDPGVRFPLLRRKAEPRRRLIIT